MKLLLSVGQDIKENFISNLTHGSSFCVMSSSDI